MNTSHMPRKIAIGFLVLSNLILTSCVHQRHAMYRDEKFDTQPDTIQISAGTDFFGVWMKNYFRKKGFTVLALNGATEIPANQKGAPSKSESRTQSAAHYVLSYAAVTAPKVNCGKGRVFIVYDYSIVNFRSGREVLSMSGEECAEEMFRRLDSNLGFQPSAESIDLDKD